MDAGNVGIEAAKVGGRGSGGDSSESLVLCPPTVETAEELEGSFSLPSGSAKATPQATEAASCSQASAVSGAATPFWLCIAGCKFCSTKTREARKILGNALFFMKL